MRSCGVTRQPSQVDDVVPARAAIDCPDERPRRWRRGLVFARPRRAGWLKTQPIAA